MSAATTLLQGRSAVVTGAAQGIGLEIGRTLAMHGAKVVLADLQAEAVEEAASSLRSEGFEAVGVQCDVTDEDAVAAVVERTTSEFDGLDIWVNNAGITRDASLKKMTLADFRLVTDVHLTGTWLGTRAASASMRAHGGGAIINISSMSGKAGNPGQTNYSAAKAGIVGLTKASAKELAHHGVRINAVQPGLIETSMTRAMPQETFAAMEASIPMRRAGQPADVANVVLFLASDLAGYMTGAVLEVAGGRLM